MGWLTPASVLPLAGYPVPDPLENTPAASAIAYAESLIEGFTKLSWGESVAFIERHRLTSKSWFLPLPLDVQPDEPLTVSPAPGANYDTEYAGSAGLILLHGGQQSAWQPGTYTITGTRGIETIPEDVNKAASLLAAHYLGLSDPERSRYSGAMLGDFGGTMRLHELPVPEAAIFLRRYRREVQATL